tara:strand:- start:32 stop:226 length:195 start_codon:yes stop_codon:yes gene_type:complete
MKAKALRDFYSIQLSTNFKKGETLLVDPKLLGEWIRNGIASEIKENKTAVKRSTKELKSKKSTK